ncbi:glycosyltransferase [Micromonospora sp. NBC_01796]|uniref:glycosyltransferase n=1 Tax=Micromonospora sp. NBC_01796 TaxID=2975987 RepID=UPI002DD8CC11|nr:glycosyltransferase [Micromonospora sp. NBC_01796]WSA87976.1 glycosyltransferase [Micromonospora sp. NBC_01796]
MVRNDWSPLKPGEIGEWQPTRSVSVVIPAYNCQESLNLTLASLSHQTYPDHLLEVVVADDGSEPPIELPKIRPTNCRIVRVPEHSTGWGRSNALHVGAINSEGEILHWLDADMVVFPEHVEAQVRWHHVSEEAVTLGYKRFVASDFPTPEEVSERAVAGTLDKLYRIQDTEPHDYVEKLINDTDQLRGGDHLNFRAHVGATAALTRTLYLAAGGLNTELRLGEDTEFGYRLTQLGAVFIPEPRAGSWHMGATHMMTKGDALRRYNHPYLAELMPHPRYLRPAANRSWAVPLITAVVQAEGSFELVRACVDRLLAGDQTDLRVKLVADWDAIDDNRRSVLADPLLDRRLLQVTYRSESRVELVRQAPETVFPSPFLLNVPPHLGVDVNTVRRMVAEADEWQAGLVRLLPTGATSPAEALALWRTSALSRAQRVRRPGEQLDKVVAEVAGERWVSGDEFGVVNLALLSPAGLTSPRPRLVQPSGKRARRSYSDTETIPVGGVRSLANATRFVARQAAIGVARKVRRRVTRPTPPSN